MNSKPLLPLYLEKINIDTRKYQYMLLEESLSYCKFIIYKADFILKELHYFAAMNSEKLVSLVLTDWNSYLHVYEDS